MAYYNCLLFDADGTLLDFEAGQRRSAAAALKQFDLPSDEMAVTTFCTINQSLWQACERGEFKREKIFKERFVRLGKQLGVQVDADALNKVYEQNLGECCDLMPDALEVLRELSECCTIAIITNGTEKIQRSRLEGSGIAHYADGFYIGDRSGMSKPNRRFFEMALGGLGVENKEKVLVIGDSIKADIEGGHNAGLTTCYFNSDTDKTAKADYVIHRLTELYAIVMEPEELAEIGSTTRRHTL